VREGVLEGEGIMTVSGRKHLGTAMFMVVLVLGLHLNILDNEATNWDDPAIFTRTVLHQPSLENLSKIFVPKKLSTFQPVRDLSYLVDFTLWGPEHENVVLGMHLHSIVLFALMVLACWLFLLALFRVFVEDEALAFTWATMASVLFAVHPVHVEGVAWLFGRKEPLLGIFTFLSLWAFIRARTGSRGYYGWSLGFMVLAILSKPVALVIPAVMAALDLVMHLHRPQPGFLRKRAAIYLPLLLIVIPMGFRLVTMMYDAGGVKPFHGGTFFTNLLAVSQIFASYAALIGFTINYAADYAITLHADPSSWQAWAFVAFNLLMAAGAVFALARGRYLLAFFVAWFYVFLAPVAHFFPIAQIMADRYALLPSLSWCVLLGYGFSRLWYLRLAKGPFSPEFPRLVSTALFLVFVLSYSSMSYRQNDIWQNSQRLWEDTLAKYPNSSPANVNLAAIYLSQQRFPEVQELCITAIKEKPYDYLAISNLALAQMMMGQYDHAINNYRQALKLKPDLVKARKGLAFAHWLAGDYENAYPVFSDLLSRGLVGGEGSISQYYHHLGFSAWKVGKDAEAREYLAAALRHARGEPRLLRDIAMAYTSMGEDSLAAEVVGVLYPLIEGQERRRLEGGPGSRTRAE
jgi:Tfp pilus assembly protein PilF